MTNPETVADVLAEMRSQNLLSTHDWADRIERAMAASAAPVGEIYLKYVGRHHGPCHGIKMLNGVREEDLPAGTKLYAHAPPAVPVESLGRDAADPVPLNAVRAVLEAVDTGRTQIARDNLRILEIHLRAQSAPPPASVPDVLTADDVQWIVNDNAELGVMIRGQAFFLYKGDSLVYDDAKHDDGTPMYYRTVGKREFGECAYPINHSDYSKQGTVSLDDSDRWQLLPPTTPEESP